MHQNLPAAHAVFNVTVAAPDIPTAPRITLTRTFNTYTRTTTEVSGSYSLRNDMAIGFFRTAPPPT
jgi:hypothetical protein